MDLKKRLALALSFLLLCLVSVPAESITVSLGEWAPYTSENLPSYGIASLLVKEAFAREGITVDWAFLPWLRAYKSAEENEVDATILWIETPERAADFLFGDVIISGKAVFFYRKDIDFKWKTWADLKKYRIGGLISASYPWVAQAKEEGVDLELELVPSEVLNFRKLASGRIDLFSQDIHVGSYIMNNELTEGEKARIACDPTVLERWDYRILFPLKGGDRSRELREKFNSGLAKLKACGEYDRLIDSYSKTAY